MLLVSWWVIENPWQTAHRFDFHPGQNRNIKIAQQQNVRMTILRSIPTSKGVLINFRMFLSLRQLAKYPFNSPSLKVKAGDIWMMLLGSGVHQGGKAGSSPTVMAIYRCPCLPLHTAQYAYHCTLHDMLSTAQSMHNSTLHCAQMLCIGYVFKMQWIFTGQDDKTN